MRKMRKTNSEIEVNVTSFAMTKNMWEYFITDNKHNDDIVCAVVSGFEVEMGDISLSEIKPYTIAQSSDLANTMPAPGWEWAD